MRPLELTPSGVLGTLAVFLIAAVCIRLGLWQLDRRGQKLDRNAVVAERMAAEPVALEGMPFDTTGLTYRRASVAGQLDGGRSVVLAGRSHAGSPGVHLLTPIRVGSGALLVNRGWLPAPDAATVELEPLMVEGEARVEGVLIPFPDVDLPRQPGFQRTWFRFNGDAVRAQFPYPVASLYLQATSTPTGPAMPDSSPASPTSPTSPGSSASSGSPASPPPPASPVVLPAPELDPGPHLSYAIQWFSFAAIFLIGWLAMLLRARREPSSTAPARPGQPGESGSGSGPRG